MNALKGMGRCKVLASTAMLSGAIFTIMLLPAQAQQDVNPDWYDPAPSAAPVHPAQPAAVAHSSQPPVVARRYQQTVKSMSPAPDARKLRVKDAQLDQSSHTPARKNTGRPSGELVSIASQDPR